MKVVTLTLNPAIDKSSTVDAIIRDKKLRCTLPVYEPGGGGINVSRALKNLNEQSLAIYLAGGPSGEKLKRLLTKEEILQSVIPIENETRENFIVVDDHGQQFRFGMPGEEIFPNEVQNILSAVKNLPPDVEYFVASGSIQKGVPIDIYAQIAKICKSKGIRVILDCDGEALEAALEEGIFFIKPNLNELAKLVGKEEVDVSDQEQMAKDLIATKKTEIIAVSMGPQGAMLAAKNLIEYAIPPSVKTVSTVGAGDSMVAGITYALSRRMDMMDVLKFGVACGSASTINPGTELCKWSDVVEIIDKISFRRSE